MNKSLLTAYQKELISACMDDFSAAYPLNTISGGLFGDTPLVWAAYVQDFIYINLIFNLIEIQDAKYYPKIDDLLATTLSLDDPNWDLNWHGLFFDGTKKLEILVEKYDLCKWERRDFPLNNNFITELIKIYSDFDSVTKDCDAQIAKQRITVAKRVIAQLTGTD